MRSLFGFARSKKVVSSTGSGMSGAHQGIPKPASSKALVPANRDQAAGAGVEPQRLIQELKDIPDGRYEAWVSLDIPQSFNRVAAMLRVGTGAAVFLISQEAFGSSAHMELLQRIKKMEGLSGHYKFLRCTSEILRALHKKHEGEALANIDTTDVEKAAWGLIEQAIEMNSSDIHVETRGHFAQVLFRVFGERIEQPNISIETATAIANVLYSVHADSSSKGVSWSKDEVKDTSIEYTTSKGVRAQVRFHSAPIHPSGNFQMVCRLLIMDEKTAKTLPSIGYTDAQVRVIEDMLVGAQGLVLLVGPTNSGKSTSMQSLARRIRERRGATMKLVTVEDPVEYILAGACQMGVPHGRKQLEDEDGNVYNTLLKATLRQDPDAVIVGEIRDALSANTVKNLVLAGRKIIATLHVFEAMAVFSRLREIGLPDSVLYMSGFISGVIYQRLVATLCPHCSVPVIEGLGKGLIDPAVFERVSRTMDLAEHNVRVRSPGGCEHCGNMGIMGRTICAEILQPDATFLDYMRKGDTQHARDYWLQSAELNVNGLGISAVAHGISKVAKGLVDPQDLEAQVGMIRIDRQSSLDSAARSPADASYAGGGGLGAYEDDVNRLAGIYRT